MTNALEIFLATHPGLEPLLCAELNDLAFEAPVATPGGVTVRGAWRDVWRANLWVRGASHVLVRIARFPAVHLAQLDKQAHRTPWSTFLRPDIPVRVEAVCRKSRIYHSGAAAQRLANAITQTCGAPVADDAPLRLLARIDHNICTVSLDTSGEPLHKRGFKRAVAKAPMRETLAAMFLRAADHRPGETLVDPMCGSGTFVIEAAEMAAQLAPGRARGFAFEHLPSFDAAAWRGMRAQARPTIAQATPCAFGSDRDAGAIAMSLSNAERAGVADRVMFERCSIAQAPPPEGPPGLVMVNPPYGKRIGDRRQLQMLYATLGRTLRERFTGWRVGLVTSEQSLARASGLPFREPGLSVSHGSIKVRLHQTSV